jgi:hypothetical protein
MADVVAKTEKPQGGGNGYSSKETGQEGGREAQACGS